MPASDIFDLAFVGHYTRDTIVYPQARRVVDGGAILYGAHVAASMGLRVAVVTRLARDHWPVVEALARQGVQVMARATPTSTCLRLVYPTSNLDERTVEMTSSAGPFTVQEVSGIRARAWHVGASVRGEVPGQVVKALASQGVPISLDVQGFLRTLTDKGSDKGHLVHDDWPGRERLLAHVTVLKADAVEAGLLTGTSDLEMAARLLAALGPQEILLTQNEGVLVYAHGETFRAPLVPVEVRGRSGRGDTCTAAYLARRFGPHGASPAEAVVWAAAVTSLKLEAEGPFRREIGEVEALYHRLRARP
jgi:sugar/nucleoside kinase (ribokinase family)